MSLIWLIAWITISDVEESTIDLYTTKVPLDFLWMEQGSPNNLKVVGPLSFFRPGDLILCLS